MKSVREEESLEGAVYSSLKTQAHSLYRLSRYKDALNVYNDALFLNPRSKSIVLDKSECLLQMGETEKALQEVNTMYPGSRRGYKNPSDNWRAGVHKSSRPPPDQTEGPVTLSDLSYKCRFLLNKADALYNKGDFENALVYYHKGHRLRPKAQEFKLGIIKTEDALKIVFSKKQQENKKQEPRKTVVRFAKPSELVKEIKEKKEETKDEVAKPTEAGDKKESEADDKPKDDSDPKDDTTGGQPGNTDTKDKDNKDKEDKQADKKQAKKKTDEKKNEAVDGKQEKSTTEHTPLEESYADKVKKEEQKRDRIKEARLAFGVKERQEARKIRARYHSRPNGHLADDIKFLNMMYRTMGETDIQNRKVKRITKDALSYLDTRNSFWGQQIPHHIREKSLILPNRDNKNRPPPTQALYAFMVKEMMRINTMIGKSQWNRAIETSKKLIDQLGKMERKIPDKNNVMANCFSMIGNCYLELGQDKKALAFHMKDLEVATKCDLDEAKLRALDNVGRVYARTGEFEKAIAIWEEKMNTPFPTAPGERAWLYHEMGYCCIEVDDPEKAKDCALKSYEAAVEKEDKKWQLNAKILLSQAMLRLGEAFEAKAEFEKAQELAKELGDADAQKKTEDALKELDEILAEWDYMGNSDDDGDFEEDVNEDELYDNEEQISQRAVSSTKSRGGDSLHSSVAQSTSKKPNQADWLLVQQEHKDLEKEEGYYDMDEADEAPSANTANNTQDSKSVEKAPTKSLPPKPKKGKNTAKEPQKKSIGHQQKSNTAKSGVLQKPKREGSNASLTSKPSRQNSNANLRGRKSRESSFSGPLKREPSNPSLNRQGRISREASHASLKTKKQQHPPEKTDEVAPKPTVNRIEETAAIYLDQGAKSMSREASIVSKRSGSKQSKVDPNREKKTGPSAAEQRINKHAIDTVAAMNDPEKSTLGMDDNEEQGSEQQVPPSATTMLPRDDKLFITENTTLTSSTVQPRD